MKDRAFDLHYARVLLTQARVFRQRGNANAFAIWLQYHCMVHRCRARAPAPRQPDLFEQRRQVAA